MEYAENNKKGWGAIGKWAGGANSSTPPRHKPIRLDSRPAKSRLWLPENKNEICT